MFCRQKGQTPKQPGKYLPSISYSVKRFIGQGSFGSVCEVDLSSPDRAIQEIINKNSWVLKTVSNEDFYPQEPVILARYQPTIKKIVDLPDGKGWFTRLLPGVMPHELEDLSYSDSLDLINNLVLTLNLHHHNTPSTGPAVVHGDIKSANLLVEDKEVNFTDYGCAFDVEDENPNAKYYCRANRNPVYFPPEAIKGIFGIKTDIYMVADIISHVIKQAEYPADKETHVTNFVTHFYAQMRDIHYDNRPDSDEVLKFFNTLNLFYKADQLAKTNTSYNDLKYEYAAKLALIAHRQWNNKINKSDETWQNYDFSNPQFNYFIVNTAFESSKQNKLIKIDFSSVKEIVVDAWKVLRNYKLVNDNVLQALINDEELCQEIIDNQDLHTLAPTLLSSFANHLSKQQLTILLNHIPKVNMSLIDVTFLSRLQGPLKECREKSLFIIQHLIDHAKTPGDVNELKKQLVKLASDNKINYLYKRQGTFTFSIHNHKWNNIKTSGTWVDLMQSIDNKFNELTNNSQSRFSVQTKRR